MTRNLQRALERATFAFEDVEDFRQLASAERQLVDLRLAISRAFRVRREPQHLTAKQAARKLKCSQSRIAKVEAGAADVPIEVLFRGLFALGGSLNDVRFADRTDPDYVSQLSTFLDRVLRVSETVSRT